MTDESKIEIDWVTQRAACSVMDMFLSVKSGALSDVEKRNVISKATDKRHFFGFKDHGSGFSVYTEAVAVPVILEFRTSGSAISVSRNGNVIHTATITFTHECECKLVVNGEELYPWQFRKKVLELLFFGEHV